MALGEADYPAYLQTVDDVPPLLAVRGNAGVLRGPLVAMVGSRNASAAGVKMAERLARELGAGGFGRRLGIGARHRRRRPPAPSPCSRATIGMRNRVPAGKL